MWRWRTSPLKTYEYTSEWVKEKRLLNIYEFLILVQYLHRSAASATGIGDFSMGGASGVVSVFSLAPGVHFLFSASVVVSKGLPAAFSAFYFDCVGYLC